MVHILIGLRQQVVFYRKVYFRDPILFFVYTNNLPEVVQSNFAIFADDTKLYRPIITPDDSNIIQSDLDLPVECCKIG